MKGKKPAILHLAWDEKFINAANYLFEKAFPGSNLFVIPRSPFNRELVNVRRERNVRTVRNGNRIIERLTNLTVEHDCVFLHGITRLNSQVFLSSSRKEKFVGMLWGGELYTEENLPDTRLVGEQTARIELPGVRYSFQERVKNILRPVIFNKRGKMQIPPRTAVSELHFISTVHEEDFEFFKKMKLISDRCRYVPFNYGPLEYITRGNESAVISGNDILLGNSASPTNNHLEAFEILKELGMGNRRIIVPLSYGDTRYAEHIQAAGKAIFKDSLVPLRSFMPLHEYTRVLQGCGIVVMNHYRQQALGNIYTLLWLGSKIYLNESNTILPYLRRIGARVFSIEKELVRSNPAALKNLAQEEVQHNRRILEETIGEERIIERLRNAVTSYFQ